MTELDLMQSEMMLEKIGLAAVPASIEVEIPSSSGSDVIPHLQSARIEEVVPVSIEFEIPSSSSEMIEEMQPLPIDYNNFVPTSNQVKGKKRQRAGLEAAAEDGNIQVDKQARKKRAKSVPTSTTSSTELLPETGSIPNHKLLALTGDGQLGRIEEAVAPISQYRSDLEVQAASDIPGLSKAAVRMRKYRADHRQDATWLSKEAERMRKMRANRKAGIISNEGKPIRENFIRGKAESLTPKRNHEEHLQKEAERVRKYRAIKKLDTEWVKTASNRMKTYRSKRKTDFTAPADEISNGLEPLPSVPVKAVDTDSEDEEAQV
jgi:hypothetical protein